MTLTVRAVNTGCVIGFHRPTPTYMRGWGATMDVPLIMFVIEGGDAPIIVDTGGDVTRARHHHGFRMEQEVIPSHDVQVLRRRVFA
jgi:N-acyl homoserine lactone hydrolase